MPFPVEPASGQSASAVSVQKTDFVTTADDLLVHDVDDGVGTVEDVGLHSRPVPSIHAQAACLQSELRGADKKNPEASARTPESDRLESIR